MVTAHPVTLSNNPTGILPLISRSSYNEGYSLTLVRKGKECPQAPHVEY